MKDLKAIYKGMTMTRSGIVRRRTMGVYQHGRCLVVALEPGDILSMREAGRRTAYTAGLGWVFMQLARKYAAEQAELARIKRRVKKAVLV